MTLQGDRFASILLEGDLVRLRPTCVEDAPTAFDLLRGRREVLDWLIWDGPESVHDLEHWYGRPIQHGGDAANYHFTIEGLADGEFLGTLGVRYEGHPHQGDVGYWVRADRWGRGYATEAVRLADWFGFARCAALLHYATVFVGNDASVRVLGKNGYVEEPAGATRVAKGGRLVERRFFSISRRAWNARDGGWIPGRVAIETA